MVKPMRMFLIGLSTIKSGRCFKTVSLALKNQARQPFYLLCSDVMGAFSSRIKRIVIFQRSPFSLVMMFFLDNADCISQEWLFHLMNHQHLQRKKLTLSMTLPIAEWSFETKDLASRLRSFYPHVIHPMDDGMIEHLFHKLFKGAEYFL